MSVAELSRLTCLLWYRFCLVKLLFDAVPLSLFAYSLLSGFLMQVYPPAFLLSPSILSTMSSHADTEHDISPDSGHRELSTDSLSASTNTQSDASWHSALTASTMHHHELISRLRDTVLFTPTFPIITSHNFAGTAPSSVSDTSNLVQIGSPPQHLVSQTVDICGRVLKNTVIQGSGLVLPADGMTPLSIADKSASRDHAQFFVNEDSKSVFDDQLR